MEVHHPDIQIAANGVTKFCSRWARQQREHPTLVVLAGPTGCGKTHMAKRVAGWASAVAFTVWSEAKSTATEIPRVRFIEWPMVSSAEKMDERDFLSFLAELDGDSMTVIDDIGAEADRFKSGLHIERLCMVFNRRAGKATLVTTNHAPEKWKECFDARVSDRLMRDSLVIEMRCPSFTSVA